MKKKIFLITIGIISIFYIQYTFSRKGAKYGFSDDEYALYVAAARGHVKKVKKLAQAGVNVNVRSQNSKRTPLHVAAQRGIHKVIPALVKNGAKLELETKGKTPLYLATEKGYIKVVKALVEEGAKITDNIIKVAKKKRVRKYLLGKSSSRRPRTRRKAH